MATLTATVTDSSGNVAVDTVEVSVEIALLNEFIIVVLPDTQSYVKNAVDALIFSKQTQWCIDNRVGKNIIYVAHVGDIVNTRTLANEWTRANKAMQILDDGHIPYGNLPGNHDFVYLDAENFYQTHFPASRSSDEPWWGGSIGISGGYNMGENNNNFQLVRVGLFEFVFLNLQWLDPAFLGSDGAYDGLISDVIAWADGILTTHAARNAIVCCHDFLNNSAIRSVNGDHWWDNLIKLHDNVRLVLSGHGQVKRNSFTNSFGSTVQVVQQNYQSLSSTGGNGYLRELTFKPTESVIAFKTRSTDHVRLGVPEFRTSSDDQFTVPYTMNGVRIAPLWFSDWRTAAGFRDNAVLDGGKWDERNLDADDLDLSVVTTASIGGGWPAGLTHAMKVPYAPRGIASAQVEIHNRWAEMTSGDNLYGRAYVKTAWANTGSQDGHFLQFEPGNAAFGFALKFGPGSNPPKMHNPQWQLSRQSGGSETKNYFLNGTGTELDDEVWRVEWHWVFVSTGNYRFHTRWYDASNVLQYTDTDFTYGGKGPETLRSRNPLLAIDDEWLRHLVIGNTGPSWTDDGFVYWGGVCFALDDWCGPYDPNWG